VKVHEPGGQPGNFLFFKTIKNNKMEIATTTIIITFGLILITIGYTFNRVKNFLFLPIAGGVLLMVLGISMFSNPITYKIGENATSYLDVENQTITLTNYEYGEITQTTNTLLSWVLTLIGFASILISVLMIYDRRFEEEKTYNW
jgi:uncharacterized membrane protein